MNISVEKEQGNGNSIDLCKKNEFVISLQKRQTCQKNTVFYINQGYLSYKDNKKIHYVDIFIVGKIVPLFNQPEYLEQYVPKDNEVKLLRPKYNTTTGNFLGLENCLAYLTVRGDFHEQFFGYGQSKDNSQVLYSAHKLKTPNSFTSTIFNQHQIQHESGAFSETDFTQINPKHSSI